MKVGRKQLHRRSLHLSQRSIPLQAGRFAITRRTATSGRARLMGKRRLVDMGTLGIHSTVTVSVESA